MGCSGGASTAWAWRRIMAQHSGFEAGQDRTEAAAYVVELTQELAGVARRHGLDTLGYLLDMARLEAENIVGSPPPSDGKGKSAHR